MFNNVIPWIKRLLFPEPPRSNPAIAEDFHRRLHLAKLRAAVAGHDGARDEGRSSEQMSPSPTSEITPELSRTGSVPPQWLLCARDETLRAAALERCSSSFTGTDSYSRRRRRSGQLLKPANNSSSATNYKAPRNAACMG
jgi:hypothetical protein